MADINLGVGGANSATGGYEIDNSCKFEADNSEELNFTPSSSGSNQTWTFSCWFKQTELDATGTIFGHYTSADNQALVRRLDTNEFSFRLVNGGTVRELKSDMLFRDTSAWYHLVVAVDTTNGTSTNRVKVYVNGEQISLTGTYPTSSLVTYGINTSSLLMDIGGTTTAGGTFRGFCGYLAEIHHIDGSQLAPTEFGETDDGSGIWKPKEYDGTYGTNGFYLDFEDAANLGDDKSGNSNNWTEVNITAVDQATDTPTNNFNIINPNQGYYFQGNTYYAYTEGATRQQNTISNVAGAATSLAVNKGKWYCEWKYTAGTNQQIFVGILAQDATASAVKRTAYSNCTTCTWYPKQQLTYYKNNGTLVTAGTTRNSSISAGDVIGMFLDMDNNHLYFQKNGSDMNVGEVDASTLLFSESNLFDCDNQFVCFYANTYDSSNQITWNWGGINLTGETTSYSDANGYGSFKYEPVRGSDNYYALCTKNLVEIG